MTDNAQADVTLPQRERVRKALRVVPEPPEKTRTVLYLTSPGTIFVRGEGPGMSFDCGYCGSPLLMDIREEQVANLVMRCANCGLYNEAPS